MNIKDWCKNFGTTNLTIKNMIRIISKIIPKNIQRVFTTILKKSKKFKIKDKDLINNLIKDIFSKKFGIKRRKLDLLIIIFIICFMLIGQIET